ncbi:F-Tk [Chelonid alphaherpesvirus 5]|uniref:F-Tk n=2 Tax=Chelonid alphaherpesvirus 5 TaxID=702736 RepID=V5NYR1_9ALPH|nr:F-Tk [Chelonid alphaherpesvirus 5]AHA93348.1 F-Tk [Chelonid alphaherpesvirus 5]
MCSRRRSCERPASVACSSRQPENSEVPVCFIFVEGAYGIGKTTTCKFLAEREAPDYLYFPEPMSYWRKYFEKDVITLTYRAQSEHTKRLVASHVTDVRMGYCQQWFAVPHLTVHRLLSALGQHTPVRPGAYGERRKVALFDRSIFSAQLIFPLARYAVGHMSLVSVLNAMGTLPPSDAIPPFNVIVMDLHAGEVYRRLLTRARKGEVNDILIPYTVALRNVYRLFLNTASYCRCHRSGWWRDWQIAKHYRDSALCEDIVSTVVDVSHDAAFESTLFQMLKQPETCSESGAPKMLIQVLLTDVINLLAKTTVVQLDLQDLSPEEAARETRRVVSRFHEAVLTPEKWNLLSDFHFMYCEDQH